MRVGFLVVVACLLLPRPVASRDAPPGWGGRASGGGVAAPASTPTRVTAVPASSARRTYTSTYMSGTGNNDHDTPSGRFVAVNDRTAILVCSEDIIRVVHTPPGWHAVEVASTKTSLVVPREACPSEQPSASVPVSYQPGSSSYHAVRRTEEEVRVTTARVVVVAEVPTGRVRFQDAETGATIAEEDGVAAFVPTVDPGDPSTAAYKLAQRWRKDDHLGESIFGGGGYQNGFLDYGDAMVTMKQFNTEAVVPFFTSSKVGRGVSRGGARHERASS